MVEHMIIGLNLNPIAVVVVVVVILVFCSYSGEAQSAIQPATPLTFGSYPTSSVWDVSSVCVIIGSLIATLLLVFILLILLRRITTSHSNYVTEESNNKCESFNGIHPQLLQTFPILCFSSINNLKEGPLRLQCAVCLANFNHGDTLRLLPQCNHVFHPPCIDAWLSSHVTCPVCRANLNHHHHSLNFATILGDTETNNHSTSGGCGSEEDERKSEEEEEEDKGEQENASKLKFMRSNSTGHSVVVECVEDMKNSIMQRSASCNSLRRSSTRGLC